MFDAEDLKNSGYDLDRIASCCELAMINLRDMKVKEAKVVLNMLENLLLDCEANTTE